MFNFMLSMVDEPSDREFITNLYHDYCRLMNWVAADFTDNQYEKEEIVQEALLRLIDKLDTIKALERKPLVSYISVTVKHTAINYLRKSRTADKRILSLYEESTEELSSGLKTVDDHIILKEHIDKLSKVWPYLSEADRFLLEGKYICGYTDAEMARTLGCKENSIRMKLTRARRNARAALAKEGVSLE